MKKILSRMGFVCLFLFAFAVIGCESLAYIPSGSYGGSYTSPSSTSLSGTYHLQLSGYDWTITFYSSGSFTMSIPSTGYTYGSYTISVTVKTTASTIQ